MHCSLSFFLSGWYLTLAKIPTPKSPLYHRYRGQAWVIPSTLLDKYSLPSIRKLYEHWPSIVGGEKLFLFYVFISFPVRVLCGGSCGTSGRDGPPPQRRYIPSIERRGRQNNFSDMSLLGEGILRTEPLQKNNTEYRICFRPASPLEKSCIYTHPG